MDNPYASQPAKIIDITEEAPNIKRFSLDLKKTIDFAPGQIIFLSIPGFGEAPFAPCNPPGAKYLELCVRRAGKFTAVLHMMKAGDIVGIRGPYGNGWQTKIQNSKSFNSERITRSEATDSKNQNLLIVVGGLGLVPLRTLIWGKNEFLAPGAKIQIFYGAKSPQEFLFHKDFDEWIKQGIDLQLTIDKACQGWEGCVGLVTKLFDEHPIIGNASAFLCGPPIMYKFTLEKLKEKNFPEKDIYVSLERRMHCGLGVCQHCAVGSFYTCKDGPVFSYNEIKDIPGAI